MYKMEWIILQHLYCTGIIEDVQKELNNFDTLQRTKRWNKKYGKLLAKEDKGIPWNKLCVYIIGPYITCIKLKKEKVNPKSVTIIYPVIGWFEITKYDNKRAILSMNLVETMWLSGYPIPM